MNTMIVSVLWSLALLLLASGVAKQATRTTHESALNVLALPAVIDIRPVRAALPWVEMLLGLLLVTGSGALLWLTTAATAVLFAVFTVVVAVGLRQGDPVSCGCFGTLSRTPITWRTVVRNLVFTTLALVALLAASIGSYRGPAFTPSWESLAAVVVPGAVLGAVVWAERAVPRAATGHHTGNVPPLPAGWQDAPTASVQQDGSPSPTADDEYHRLPVPYLTVHDSAGNSVSLREQSRLGARALFTVSPGCAPCREVMDRMERWPGRVGPVALHAVVGSADLVPLLPQGLRGHALVDVHGALTHTFDAVGTPWAVVLGADQLLAGGPEVGGPAVLELLMELEERFGMDTHPQHVDSVREA